MQLKNQIKPTKEQLQKLFATYPADTPISMLNIMRCKAHVEEKNKSGREVYQSYVENATPFIKAVGGTLVWQGEVQGTLIGDDSDEPQLIFVVNYPTIEHFKKMITNPAYQEVAKTRTMSIEYGGLIALTQQFPAL